MSPLSPVVRSGRPDDSGSSEPRRPAWPSWLLVCAGALTLGLAALFPVWTNDLFGHLAAGRQIAELGRVPDHDTFSFYFDTPQPWRNHNWASCLVFWLVYSAGGVDALVLLKVALCTLLGALVLGTCDRRTFEIPLAWLIWLWAVPSLRQRFTVRPHLFGLMFCAVLLFALSALSKLPPERRAWRTIAALGLLQLAWVNLHGSAPMAFLLTLAFVAGHFGERARQKQFMALLVVQVLASCITPFGPSMMLETVFHVGSEGTRAFIGEWAPLVASDNPWDVPVWTMLLLLTLWGAPALWREGARARSRLLVTFGLLIMAYRSLRFVAEPILLGAPCIAAGLWLRLSSIQALSERPLKIAIGALAAVGALVTVRVTPDLPPYQPLGMGMSTRNLPVEPGRWLEEHRPHARTAGLMEDAWYVSFAVPKGLVLIDGRQAVYPLEVLEAVTAALTAPEQLLPLIVQKRADAIILRHGRAEHARSIAALTQDTHFGIATIGDRHVLFVRGLGGEQAISTLWPNMALRTFTPEQEPSARLELARIGQRPGTLEYVGFQGALLRVSGDLLADGHDGLLPIADDAQRQRYATALRELGPALVPNENRTTAQLLATMLQLALCRLDQAAESLALARAEGENRHTIALGVELAIRDGDIASARGTLDALGGARDDAWLGRLERELERAREQPACAGAK